MPVVLTMLVMPLTFSITNGIGAGFVSYVLIKLASGKGRRSIRRSMSSPRPS